MPASQNPVFAAALNCGAVSISTANVARDGTGTMGTLITAGANGTLVQTLRVLAVGTTTAGMVRVFVHNGTSAFLYEEIPVTAITPSGTVQAFAADSAKITPATPLLLPSGWSLRVSTNNAETFHVTGQAGDL
jgi:hypothetical protein